MTECGFTDVFPEAALDADDFFAEVDFVFFEAVFLTIRAFFRCAADADEDLARAPADVRLAAVFFFLTAPDLSFEREGEDLILLDVVFCFFFAEVDLPAPDVDRLVDFFFVVRAAGGFFRFAAVFFLDDDVREEAPLTRVACSRFDGEDFFFADADPPREEAFETFLDRDF